MNIFAHIIVNMIAGALLKYSFQWDWKLLIIFIIAGAAIDIDHLLFFIFKYKEINPKNWIVIGKEYRNKMQPGLYVFHSPEFNIILLLFSFINEIILIILISNLIHISLDIFEHYHYHKNLSWIKKWSVVYSLK